MLYRYFKGLKTTGVVSGFSGKCFIYSSFLFIKNTGGKGIDELITSVMFF